MRKRDKPVCRDEQPAEDRPHLEPGKVYLSGAEINALPPLSSRRMLTEEECQAALVAYPEVHPGWKFAFQRSREVMEELRRKREKRTPE